MHIQSLWSSFAALALVAGLAACSHSPEQVADGDPAKSSAALSGEGDGAAPTCGRKHHGKHGKHGHHGHHGMKKHHGEGCGCAKAGEGAGESKACGHRRGHGHHGEGCGCKKAEGAEGCGCKKAEGAEGCGCKKAEGAEGCGCKKAEGAEGCGCKKAEGDEGCGCKKAGHGHGHGCAHGKGKAHKGLKQAKAGHHHGHHAKRFKTAEDWAKHFDSPERDAWQQGDKVVAALATRDDLRVVDIGAGTGYFAVRFARAVPKGQVFGVDIEQSMVDYLAKRAQTEGLTNVSAHLGGGSDPKLGALSAKADLVFLSNTYHHIPERPAYFRAVRDHVAPGGRLAIVDFRPDARRGPPKEHKIAAASVEAELKDAGWKLAETHDFLSDQYILVFEAE